MDTNEQVSDLEAKSLPLLLDQLGSSSRRTRQEASRILSAIASVSAKELLPYAADLVKAAARPEAQTRWQALDALSCLCDEDYKVTKSAFASAEESLFDESSAAVRVAAFKFLCKLGAASKAYSDKCWPLLDEAIQCYHGDPEYRDMLTALHGFAQGTLSKEAAEGLVQRVRFDAEHGRGYIKAMSEDILTVLGAK